MKTIEDHINVTEPTSEEVEKIIGCLKNNKSPGKNGSYRINKIWRRQLVAAMVAVRYDVIKKILRQEEIPVTWK